MKKILLPFSLALLALASAHGQVLRSGLVHRHGRSDTARHERGDRHEAGRHHRDFGRQHGWHYSGHGRGAGHWHAYSYAYRPFYTYGYYRDYGLGYPYARVYGPSYGYGTVYGYSSYPSAASNGLWLGALAGGIVGHNSGTFGHNAWRGAAWGAGAGWLLGTIADANRRAVRTEMPRVVMSAPAAVVTAAPRAVATPTSPAPVVRVVPGASSMTAANALFGRQ